MEENNTSATTATTTTPNTAPATEPVQNQPGNSKISAGIEEAKSIFVGNGMKIALGLVVLAAIITIFTLFNLGTSKTYQGLIQKVELETKQLQVD